MHVGQKFSSFLEFEDCLALFEDENFVKFFKRSSRKIQAAVQSGKTKVQLNPDLVYYEIKYSCVRGGVHRVQGEGKRKTSSHKIECAAHVSLRAAADGKTLEVKSFDNSHNHEVSKELYDHLSRQLSESQKSKAREYIALGANENLVQQKLQKDLASFLPDCVGQIYARVPTATSYIAIEDVEVAENEELVSTFDPNDVKVQKRDANKENSAVADEEMVDLMEDEASQNSAEISTFDQSQVTELAENNESSSPVDRLTCRICSKKFSKISNKQCHIRREHNFKRQNGTSIRCIECNVNFSQISRLRAHLAYKHKLEMDEQKLCFPSMEAFKKWKCEIERKTVCSYTLRHGARKGPQGPRYFYVCHRSGKYSPKVRGPRQRMMKTQGSCKMGIMCTASIGVKVNQTHVSVVYCPHHYGHGKETTLIQLTSEEQSAIAESVSKGVPYEKLLDDVRDSQSSKDHFQLHLLKKKDYRSINNSYNSEDFNIGISDAESVDHWVNSCCQMENSPILYYRKEEFSTEKGDQEEFLLIIMTEFQKHILLSFDKNVICVDSLYRKKGGRFYLTVLFIMDENELAFPVAFCVSNKVDKNVIIMFFRALYESAGPLECNFFMSDSESFYYEAWKEIMGDKSKWLWSMWYVDSRFRIQLRVFRGNVAKRAAAYKTMRMLLECQNQTVFQCMLENFIESLRNDPDSKDLSTVVKNHYAPNAEIWAYCFRKEIDLGTNIHLEIMHRTFRYCCREGRKKRLDKFIFAIMKLVRDKMLDRLTNMMDSDRIDLAIETINVCHNLGLEISSEHITALSDKTWLIRTENEEDENYYVMLENPVCPEHCNLKCSECDICVHMYTCSCIHNLINANLCQHIHAVVWHLLTPHFTPPSSPVPLLDKHNETLDASSEFLQKLLKKTHEVYKQIQANKCKLNRVALNSLMKHMNECVEICSEKILDEEKQPPVESMPTLSTTTATTTTTNPGTFFLINPGQMKGVGNQQLVISNPVTNVINSNSVPQTGYVLIVPNTPNPTVKSKQNT